MDSGIVKEIKLEVLYEISLWIAGATKHTNNIMHNIIVYVPSSIV